MKVKFILALFLLSFLKSSAQNLKIWGVIQSGGDQNNGEIYNLDVNGNNFKSIYEFKSNLDGAGPGGGLVEAGGFVYGLVTAGGANGHGAVYRVSETTGVYEVLHSFNVTDGDFPQGALTLGNNGQLFGTTAQGGANASGTVFSMNTDGSGFTTLVDFNDSNGSNPIGPLLLASNGDLYGTTPYGGGTGFGTLFRVQINGTSFQKLLDFGGSHIVNPVNYLVEGPGGKIFGMSEFGGSTGKGGIFTIDLAGTNYTEIFHFTDIQNSSSNANGGLILGLDGSLYGTSSFGGSSHLGAIFKINTDGNGYTSLFEFTSSSGSHPLGRITQLAGGSLLCMTSDNGLNGLGTVIKVNSNGSGLTKLFDFSGIDNGASPMDGYILPGSDGAFYTAVYNGGVSGNGTILRIAADGATVTKIKEFPSGPLNPIMDLSDGNDGYLYGTSLFGGYYGFGTVFKIQKNGQNLTTILDFDNTTNGFNAAPLMIGQDGSLYGQTAQGGQSNSGVIYKIHKDGSGFTKLHDFSGIDGKLAFGSLMQAASGEFYGMTLVGGTNSAGVIFKLNSDGSGFTKIFDLVGLNGAVTGGQPRGHLVQDANGDFYGLCSTGGASSKGTIFKLSNGVFTKLFDFSGANGANPNGSPILASDGKLYGATRPGGPSNLGVIFSISTDGSGFSDIVNFNGVFDKSPSSTGLVEYNGKLLGVTNSGGSFGTGSLFSVNLNGTGYTKLVDFVGRPGFGPGGQIRIFDTPPTIDSFAPTSGPAGTSVVLTGNYFDSTPSNNLVKFNGTIATVTASTATSITTSVPVSAASGAITITINGDTATSANNFTVIPTPTISGFTPSSGPEGSSVTISGTNFDTTPANNRVKFNGTTAVVIASTSTGITTGVPVGATTGAITVTVSDQTATSADNFTVIPTPTISGFTPSSGPEGSSVTIAGTNFDTTPANNLVKFNGTTAVVIASTSTGITTNVPVGATTGAITVTVTDQTATSSNNFTVIPTPAISGFTPTSGPVGATVTINGTNFDTTPANNIVTFNGTPAIVSASTTISITTTVPAGATTGAITVTVNGQIATSAYDFTITPPPSITGFTPLSGPAGTAVIITGTNFDTTPVNNVLKFNGKTPVVSATPDVIIVKFNGTTATVSASTNTSITTTVPVGATTGAITVTVNGQTATSADNFTVIPPPSITGFTPLSGPVGTTVIITGADFDATPANNIVKFDGTTASVSASTSASITTAVPIGAFTGAITVTVNGQSATSATSFTVQTITGDIRAFSNSSDIKLYPNPAKDEITVGLENLEKGVSVELVVYDMAGRQVDHKVSSGGNRLTLDIRDYLRGNYIINAVQNRRTYAKQFIKE